MSIVFKEKPTSRKGKVSRSDPETTLEVWASGAADENELELGIEGWLEETYTVNGITRFFEDYTYDPVGNGIWNISLHYRKSPDTTELSVHPGGGTRKVYQSLQTMRSYSCIDARSATTSDAAMDAIARAEEAIVLSAVVTGLVPAILTAQNDARIAADVVGVDPVVRTSVILCADITFDDAVPRANQCVTAIDAAAGHAIAAATAALAGNPALAGVEATLAEASRAQALNQRDLFFAFRDEAVAAAAQAEADAAGGNAQTLTAASAASTAAFLLGEDNSQSVAVDIVDAVAEMLLAVTAARTAANAATADNTAGGNGVPNFRRAIGVTDKSVEGVDVPDRKFEFTLNKKFSRAAVSGAYIMELYSILNTTNNADFTLVYNGQTLTFSKGTMLFLEFPFKMNSRGELDITYKFGVQYSILLSQGFTIGNSGSIEKIGWEHLWVSYQDAPDQSAHVFTKRPICVIIDRVFDESDYSRILL